MAAMICVNHLRKVYRVGQEKVVALNNINLEIPAGEFCCIVGASGSGKSTLLNQLAGLEKPTAGSVVIAGENVSAMTENQLAVFRQNSLGFVFQSYNLLPTMTAVENVALPLLFKGMGKEQREKIAAQKLREMGLGKRMRHKPTEMSGGQQQRVGIARAFAGNPKVIFADEPTGNLDSHTTAQVMNAVLRLTREHGITFVMVTHEHDLSGCADRIITLKDGIVVGDERITRPIEVFAEQRSMMDAAYDKQNDAADDGAAGGTNKQADPTAFTPTALPNSAPPLAQAASGATTATAQAQPTPPLAPGIPDKPKAKKLTVPRGSVKTVEKATDPATHQQPATPPAAKGDSL